MAAGPVARSRAQIPLRLCFFFFYRQTTECMRSEHFFYRTTELLDRQAETHLS